ncbi:MAG: VCBS repeat-containing protein [Acidobacteria bacterium]|nr:VCBS repeat-containing protein [Acidobacteriota bacterium]
MLNAVLAMLLASTPPCIPEILPVERLEVNGTPTMFADVTGDGRADGLWFGSDEVRCFRNVQGRRFADGVTTRTSLPFSLARQVVDIDGDGLADLILVLEPPLWPDPWVGVALVSDGACHFTERRLPEISPTIGDVNGDLIPDLVVATWTLPSAPEGGKPSTFVRFGLGNLTFGPSNLVEADVEPEALADANGDGHLDILVVDRNALRHVRLGDGQGGFPTAGPPVRFLSGPAPSRLETFEDLDGDARADLLYRSFSGGLRSSLNAFRSMGDGSFQEQVPCASGLGSLLHGDLNGDGRVDFVAAPYQDGLPSTLLIAQSGSSLTFAPLTHSGFTPVMLGDLDGTGRMAMVGRGVYGTLTVLTIGCSSGRSTQTADLPIWGLTSAWRTGLTVSNEGETTALAELRSADGRLLDGRYLGPRTTQTFSSSPPETGTYPAFLSVSGLSRPGALIVEARVERPGSDRTLLARVPVAGAFSSEPDRVVPWLRNDDRKRTNLALAHGGRAGDAPIDLLITLNSTDPEHREVVLLLRTTLEPGERRQLDGVMKAAKMAAKSGYAEVRRIRGSAAYDAYAAVNENETGDGSVIPGVVSESFEHAPFVLSVITGGSYQTRLILSNPGLRAAEIRIRAGAAGDGITLTVRPQGLIELEDATTALAAMGLGITPSFTGPILLDVTGDDVFIAAEVGPRFPAPPVSVLVTATPIGRAARDEAWLTGFGNPQEGRTNLAVARADWSEGPMRVAVELRSPRGVQSTIELEIPRAGISQIRLGDAVSARVVRTEGEGRFVA